MIGFDVPPELKDLKKNLLMKHHIFTGEAKPNVIRLLPSLALTKADADKFLNALREEVATLSALRCQPLKKKCSNNEKLKVGNLDHNSAHNNYIFIA